MDGWTGAHESELIQRWGPPVSTLDGGNGDHVLMYQGSGLNLPCMQFFRVNPEGRIVRWSYEHCPRTVGKKEAAEKARKI